MKYTLCILLSLFSLAGCARKTHQAGNAFQPKSFTYLLQPKSDQFLLQIKGEEIPDREKAVRLLTGVDRELVVIDYSFTGERFGKWTPAEIRRIRNGRKGRKMVSYISIGEAEDYRFYWHKPWDANRDGIPDKGAPDFLEAENPDWAGNYKVKYWNPEWQKHILRYVDEIIDQGFDGIYLDIVDGFQYFEYDRVKEKWHPNKTNPETEKSYRRDMVDWVLKIAAHARKKKRKFLIIPQNGSQLSEFPDFVKAINAIGIEDLFTEGDVKQSEFHTKTVLDLLEPIKKSGKRVLVIEYPTGKSLRQYAREQATHHQFTLLITDRPLKTLGL